MDDIKGTLFKISKMVTKTSTDLMKGTKLSMSLSSEEDGLKNLYIEIGKKVHEIYMYGGSLGKFFDEKYKEIEAQEVRINDLRAQLDIVKGTKTCPKCGKSIDKNAEFCPKCGLKLVEGAVAEVKPETENNVTKPAAVNAVDNTAAPSKVKCRLCGAENEEGSKFCLSCGRMLQ